MKRILLLAVFLGVVCLLRAPGAPSSAAPDVLERVYIDLPGPRLAADDSQLNALGGVLRHTFDGQNTISADVPISIVPALQHYSRFFNVRPVGTMTALQDGTDWGVRDVNAPNVWGNSTGALDVVAGSESGLGIKVAVIDTGSGPHADLNVVQRVVMFATPKSGLPCTTTTNDDNGHGTHVAGTIAALDNGFGYVGVAPSVSLYSVKVLDCHGAGNTDDIAAGIDWARQNGMNVVNMSLGCTNPAICADSVLQNAITNAYNAGVLLVAAAGNSGNGTNTVGYPALYNEVIAVAAVCPSGAQDSFDDPNTCNGNINSRASFSSTGPKVELSAPGDNIWSTALTGLCDNCDNFDGNADGYTHLSGTSMASPHVAGVGALLMSCGLTNVQARAFMNSTALDLGSSGRDNSFGWGLVQANAAIIGGCGALPASHDVAVTQLTALPANVTIGSSTTLTATVQNQGNRPQTNLTVTFTDTTAPGSPTIGTKPIASLAAGASTSVQLVWNTTGFLHGQHSIRASLAVLTGETDTADNTRTTSVGVISQNLANCPIAKADVDHDYQVSALDLAAVAGAFLQSVPPANAAYDQDGDGVISALDIAHVATYFLQNVSACP